MTFEGIYHTIETFGTVDGPGIRYVLFLQGCPLRCKYCHNRDTWEMERGNKITVNEVISDIKPYLRFYKNSGGGLTISGGEPTLQSEFVKKVFTEVKKLGLNTALDTSGFVRPEKVTELLGETDLVLLDIKALEPEEHKELTGVSNEQILEFARFLEQINKPIWIRHVLIPGVNDSQKHLLALAKFIKDYSNIQKVEILGYHKLGVHKWEVRGEHDPFEEVSSATEDDVNKAKIFLKEQGIASV